MKKIGLLIQDLTSEYSNSIIKGSKKYCLEKDIQLFVFIVRRKNWSEGFYEYQHFACKSLASKYNVDGLLLVTNTYCQNSPEEEHASLIKNLEYLPLVSFGAKIDGHSSINTDPSKDFEELLVHLEKEHGCRNIYFMGPVSNSKDIILRFNIYKEFLAKRNLPYENRIIYANYTYENAKASMAEKNISRENLPFDALVCCNDDIAFGCIDYLREQGIRVPEEVKVTGFDNQMRCDFTKPGLTSIDLCIEDQCYEAARLLSEEISDPGIEKQNLHFDSKIIYRQSCGCSRATSVKESSEGKYFQLREQVYHYQYFLQDLEATVETENIKALIMKYYKDFGIESCVCCIYDHPKKMEKNEDFVLPEKARVFFAYNSEKEFSYSSDFFIDPEQNLYPEDFVFAENKEIIVTSLFNQEYQYGYLVYTPGDMNYSTYELIVTTTGISLATNIVFSKTVEETKKLSVEKKTLETETYYDEMTGAMNRRGLAKYALPAMKSALERGLTGGVIFGDMDHLKLINDNFGHEAGDRAIKGEVEILKSVFRTQDIIARLGGDEFVIVACGLVPSAFVNIKERINSAAKKFNEEHNEPFEISISLGYVEFNRENRDLESLINQADEMQYKEKVLHHKNRQ